MCKDMKKNPNSPANRLPNSPHPPEKSEKVYESTGQRVLGAKESALGLLGSVMGPKGPKSRTPI